MGQKISAGTGSNIQGKKEEGDVGTVFVDNWYERFLKSDGDVRTESEFYQAICEIVGKINRNRGLQIKIPTTDQLKRLFEVHHTDKRRPLSKEEFKKILEEVAKDAKMSGSGGWDALLYTFGVPAAATLVKNAVMPNIVQNEILIPFITSLTVLVLAKLNKI